MTKKTLFKDSLHIKKSSKLKDMSDLNKEGPTLKIEISPISDKEEDKAAFIETISEMDNQKDEKQSIRTQNSCMEEEDLDKLLSLESPVLQTIESNESDQSKYHNILTT